MPEPVSSAARCYLVWCGATPVARLSAEVTNEMPAVADRVGIVGHYEALLPGAGIALLRRVREELAAAGAAVVIGPMNGSSWSRYRLVLSDTGDEPPFPGEPWSPPGYAGQFAAAGFTVAARYESRIMRDPGRPRPGAAVLAARMETAGITVRPLAIDRLESELHELYDLSAAAFASAPFFRPLEWEGFRALYAPLVPMLDLDLILLARDRAGRLLGFLFALPSFPGTGRAVLKTLAVAPAVERLGLGAHLADRFHAITHRKGYAAVIHALMHQANPSVALSQRYGSERFREYALYRAAG